MYAGTEAWKAYQPLLPTNLRCEGDRVPAEEYWSWRSYRVHLDRHVNERAAIKLLALHGGGGNGRLMAPVGIADPVGGGNRVPISFMASWLRSQRPVDPERFPTPVLLAHPGEDRWTPPQLSLRFLERISAPTTYVELANCGHFPVEEPGVSMMRTSVLAFLRGLLDETAATNG